MVFLRHRPLLCCSCALPGSGCHSFSLSLSLSPGSVTSITMTVKRSLLVEADELPAAQDDKLASLHMSRLVIPAAPLAGFHGAASSAPPSTVSAILRMEGAGDASYVKYSSGQANINAELRPMLATAIRTYTEFPSSGPIRVADLGCSVGANALGFAECISNAVLEKFKSLGLPAPEIQHFFSDLPSNDFNLLFSLMPHLKSGEDDWGNLDNCREMDTTRSYYAAAVPGSFYDRLFPRESLHVVMSTWSMHWLSHIPTSVTDKSSPAYNKGKVWINEGSPAVAEEYSKVSKENLKAFFVNRGVEMVSGGLLFVMLMSRKDPCRKEIQFGQPLGLGSPICGMFELAWNDLVDEGVVDEDTRDSFNMPIYCPSADEITEAIDESSAFRVEKLEIWEDIDFLPRATAVQLATNPERWGAMAMNMSKTMMLTLVEAHVGPEVAAKLWDRLQKQVTAHCRRTKTVFCANSPGCNIALAFLVKK